MVELAIRVFLILRSIELSLSLAKVCHSYLSAIVLQQKPFVKDIGTINP